MAFEPEHRKLPDGRTIYDRLWTAKRWGVTPPTVNRVAERFGVQRFASKTRGGVAHYYLAEDVERVRQERFKVEPVVQALEESGQEFVALPYEQKSHQDSK